MRRLIIVSNRLPVTVSKIKGKYIINPSVGGLATGINSLEISNNCKWVGWPGFTKSKKFHDNDLKELEKELRSDDLIPVYISKLYFDDYYQGFCNEMIWPLFHYFVQYAHYNKNYWDAYLRVNGIFCEKILEISKPDDLIWIHDYHLMLLPQLLRKSYPNISIGFFLHIPFPSSEIFRLIPWCNEIIQGLLGADLIGFHTFDYVRHFLESIRRILGHEHTLGKVTFGNRIIKVDSFPMGIDFNKFSNSQKDSIVQKNISKLKKDIGKDYKVILSIDRLDYTKGIPERLEAFDIFLKNYPMFRGKVIFIMVAVPSRIEVTHYKLLKDQVDNLIGRINGKYGKIGWVPIWYLYRSFEFDELTALYSIADVLFLTPLRDGMNLVAKEYIATKVDQNGVLILGEMAGTAKELSEAIVINPNDQEKTADALKDALEMDVDEKKIRMKSMRARLKRYDIARWSKDFTDQLTRIKEEQKNMEARSLTRARRKNLIYKYRKSKRALFLLDYDGTLAPFNSRPELVFPDSELKKILAKLNKITKNSLIIISGRDRHTLEKWVDKFTTGLVAEHGVWIKDDRWQMIDNLSDEWKENIRPILETFVDRTPGSFVEEKAYSLVWHFRKVDPALAVVRVGELMDVLLHITANLNVGVLEGNKVIEIKDTGIDKGRAAIQWISKIKPDFILSIGDDWTDEDVFEVLPDWAFSIKVGYEPSKARYNISNYYEVRKLLNEL